MTKPVRLADVKADRAHAAWDVFTDRVEAAFREAWPAVSHALVLAVVERDDLRARPGQSAACIHPLSLCGPGNRAWRQHRREILPALRGACDSWMQLQRVPVRSTRMPRLRRRGAK